MAEISAEPTRAGADTRRAAIRLRSLAGPLAGFLVVVMALGALGTPTGALGASCAQLTLSSGSASPGSGTTSTQFTFSVTYRSSCAPTSVTVTIGGVGTLALSGTWMTPGVQVVFSRTLTLPAGSHAYSFTASNGTKTRSFTAVLPATVVVSGPTPKPTAAPTPKPTPKPTPTPKPAATTAPTARPTPAPAAAAAPSSSSAPSETPTGSPLTGGIGGGSGSPTAGGDGSGTAAAPPGSGQSDGGAAIALAVLATTVGIGLLLAFAILTRRRRMATSVVVGDTLGAVDALAARAPADAPIGEAHLPRWRRPSLQAARQAPSLGLEPPHAAVSFSDPPAEGVERRRIGYRLVRVASIPDDRAGDEIARLDRGDEVELIRSAGAYWLVRTPTGAEGWIQQETLIPIDDPA